MLENPNFDDPISPYFQPRETLQEYINDIKNYRKGKKVSFMDCLLDEVIESSSRVSVKTGGENTITKTDEGVDDGLSIMKTGDKVTAITEDVNDELVLKEHAIAVPKTLTSDACSGLSTEQSHKDDEQKTKRQISEDSIVEASNKIFLIASGEKVEQTIARCVSIDESPDFEELMYTHFMYTETES